MLWFNDRGEVNIVFLIGFQYILCYGSTYLINNNFFGHNKFQYILCYGSTKKELALILDWHNFNTSYVMVQPPFTRCTTFWTRYFNTSYVMVQLKWFWRFLMFAGIFQYILCYGSTIAGMWLLFSIILRYCWNDNIYCVFFQWIVILCE